MSAGGGSDVSLLDPLGPAVLLVGSDVGPVAPVGPCVVDVEVFPVDGPVDCGPLDVPGSVTHGDVVAVDGTGAVAVEVGLGAGDGGAGGILMGGLDVPT